MARGALLLLLLWPALAAGQRIPAATHQRVLQTVCEVHVPAEKLTAAGGAEAFAAGLVEEHGPGSEARLVRPRAHPKLRTPAAPPPPRCRRPLTHGPAGLPPHPPAGGGDPAEVRGLHRGGPAEAEGRARRGLGKRTQQGRPSVDRRVRRGARHICPRSAHADGSQTARVLGAGRGPYGVAAGRAQDWCEVLEGKINADQLLEPLSQPEFINQNWGRKPFLLKRSSCGTNYAETGAHTRRHRVAVDCAGWCGACRVRVRQCVGHLIWFLMVWCFDLCCRPERLGQSLPRGARKDGQRRRPGAAIGPQGRPLRQPAGPPTPPPPLPPPPPTSSFLCHTPLFALRSLPLLPSQTLQTPPAGATACGRRRRQQRQQQRDGLWH